MPLKLLFRSSFLIALLAFIAAGCVTGNTSTRKLAAENVPFESIEYLQSGDKVSVILTDIPNAPITNEQTITDDGEITLHLNYTVKAVGKTRKQLQQEIHSHYVPRYYSRCTVTIRADERYFYVRGQVKVPNRYIYSGDLTLLKAITAAGGFTDFAKDWAVEVTRLNGTKITVNCRKAQDRSELDVAIYPGDIVFVDRRVW